MAKNKCKSCKGCGVLFFRIDNNPMHDYPNIATIERCDVCMRFKTDHTASKAVEKVWRAYQRENENVVLAPRKPGR